MRSSSLLLRSVLGTAVTAGALVGGLTVVDALAADDVATPSPTSVDALALDDAARARDLSFAGPAVDQAYPDATPKLGDPGTTGEPIGFPDEIVAAAAEAPAPAPAPAPQNGWSLDWDRLAQCESHGEWDYGPHSGWGNGLFEGGLQFDPDTWDAYKPAGYPEAAYQATKAQQILVAERVLAEQGLGAWPACTRKLGWR